jgi:hypothetical protein
MVDIFKLSFLSVVEGTGRDGNPGIVIHFRIINVDGGIKIHGGAPSGDLTAGG